MDNWLTYSGHDWLTYNGYDWLTYNGYDWLTYNGYDWLIHTYLDYNKNQVISELRVANKDDSVSKNDPMGKYLFSKILGWYDYSIWDGVV